MTVEVLAVPRSLGAMLAAILCLAGCTSAQLTGASSVYVVLEGLTAAAGAAPADFGGSLASDVQTYVKKDIEGHQVCVPTVFADSAKASFRLALKDPGGPAAPTTPTVANTVTFTRYHVDYIRADGRRVPGEDVPYGFDGGMTTAVVGADAGVAVVTLVRVQAKEEPPLKQLVAGGGARTLSVIAEVTFYGADAAGRPVSVTGHTTVDFSDWSDPEC